MENGEGSREPMAIGAFWNSTVGKKVVMGATGILLVAFVVLHMLGNLQFFAGADRFNAYSHLLQVTLIEVTWLLRAGLLAAVALHITAAVQLTRRNWAARPDKYRKREPQVSTYAARSLRWGGLYLLAFIPYHLMHFTIGTVHPAFIRGDAYGNVMVGFQSAGVVLFYLGAMAFLALHLYHGAWAAFRTLGVAPRSAHPLHRKLALGIALLVPAGFSLLPLSVFLGWAK